MERLLGRYSPYLYALLRIVAGFLFFQHGLPKLFGGFGRPAPVELMSQMGLAGIIEVVGGALISIGLFTSPVAFVASGEMAVAYFQAHAPRDFWPIGLISYKATPGSRALSATKMRFVQPSRLIRNGSIALGDR